jgi:dTDP-glucose pyrophosphorylase
MNATDVLESLTVRPETPIIDAIKVITAGGQKIALVVDESRILLGVVTDYDVRQAILNHIDFQCPVTEIMARNPVTAKEGVSDEEIVRIIQDQYRHQIPVVDSEGRLVDIHFIGEYQHLDKPPNRKTAVIMAGGFGTRLKPMTDHTPKPLLLVGGRPILFIMLDQILTEKFDHIFITLNYKSEMIVDAINAEQKYKGKIDFIFENKPLGTAGSLSLLPERPADPFVVINADLLTSLSLNEMLAFHLNEENHVTMATKRESNSIPYGVVEFNGSKVTKLDEKPTFTYFVNMGVYVINPEVLDLIGKETYIDMPNIVEQLLEAEKQVGGFPVHEYWLDIGNHDQFEQAQEDYVNHFSAQEGNFLD